MFIFFIVQKRISKKNINFSGIKQKIRFERGKKIEVKMQQSE